MNQAKETTMHGNGKQPHHILTLDLEAAEVMLAVRIIVLSELVKRADAIERAGNGTT